MVNRIVAAAVSACLLAVSAAPNVARADNQMGYRIMSQQEAASLPRNGGAIGLDVERSRQIADDGLVFDLLRVKGVRRGSPGAKAGFNVGDQIIAVDGRVFPTIAAFASYVGSNAPGAIVQVDYIPRTGGPGQAQRVGVLIGGAAERGAQAQPGQPGQPGQRTGMSTGEKVAIGVGAAALLGCYEMGCFTRSTTARSSPPQPEYPQQFGGQQQYGGQPQYQQQQQQPQYQQQQQPQQFQQR